MTSPRAALQLAAICVLVILAAGCGGSHTVATTVTVTKASAVKPQVTAAERKQAARIERARARAAAAQKKTQAAAARAGIVARKAAAKRAATAAAVANAWHSGYLGPGGDNLDVYGRWRTDLRCADYATNGCMHFEAITENGCSYLSISVNEMQGGAIVGNMLANQLNVPPKTPVVLELDADRAGVTAGSPTIQCN